LQIIAKEHRKQKHVLKFVEAEENHGDRRELDMHVRVLQELHSRQAVELYLLQHQEIILSSSIRRKREALLSLHFLLEFRKTS
jgi:hypothetical protein